MENLGKDVVETALEVTNTQTCPIKRALPVAAIIAVGAGVVFVGTKLVKKIKAKRATKAAKVTENTEPESN